MLRNGITDLYDYDSNIIIHDIVIIDRDYHYHQILRQVVGIIFMNHHQ